MKIFFLFLEWGKNEIKRKVKGKETLGLAGEVLETNVRGRGGSMWKLIQLSSFLTNFFLMCARRVKLMEEIIIPVKKKRVLGVKVKSQRN